MTVGRPDERATVDRGSRLGWAGGLGEAWSTTPQFLKQATPPFQPAEIPPTAVSLLACILKSGRGFRALDHDSGRLPRLPSEAIIAVLPQPLQLFFQFRKLTSKLRAPFR